MTGVASAPGPAGALLDALAGAPRLVDLDDAGYRAYCDRLAAASAEPGEDPALIWALVKELTRVGDRTAIIDFGMRLADAPDLEIRRGAVTRAAWGLGQLGYYHRALGLLEDLEPAPSERSPFAVEHAWVRSIIAYMRGDYEEMGALCDAQLALIPALPAAALEAHFQRPAALLRHHALVNLAISRVLLADREQPQMREALLDEAARLIADGESAADFPDDARALYDDNRGELLARRDPAAALAHFDAAIARHRGSADARFALTDLHRHRGLARAAAGDRPGAIEDLLEALGHAMAIRHAFIERQVAGEIFALIAAHAGTRRESELLENYHLESDSALGRLFVLWRAKDRHADARRPAKVASRVLHLYRGLGGAVPGVGELSLELAEAGALLWDVGHLLLPWTVVNRPRPVSALERELLDTRVAEGFRLAASFGFPRVARVLGARAPAPGASPDPHALVIAPCHEFESRIFNHPLNAEPLAPVAALAHLRAQGVHMPVVLDALERDLARRWSA